MGAKIKTEFLNTVIGFNNSALPLGERNDLHILADIAQKSNDTSLLNLFEELPNQEEIQSEKVEKLLEETADAITPEKKPRINKKQTDSETNSAE